MIKSLASKETEKLFKRELSRKIPNTIQQIARRKLEILNAAEVLQDLRIPPSKYLGLSERFWINLQARYDLEIEKDRLKDRLNKEVHVYATAV